MDLVKQAYLSDEDFLKTVFSSGDYFPGFYRYNLSSRIVRPNQLRLSDIITMVSEEALTHHREDWLNETRKYYHDIEHRDLDHGDIGMYRLMRKTYDKWMFDSDLYGIMCLDSSPNEREIVKDQTYFFMGSNIRLTDDSALIGYNDYENSSVLSIKYDSNSFLPWLNKIYEGHLNSLFLPSKVIGELVFKGDMGTLEINEELLLDCMTYSEPVVFGSNKKLNSKLPIQWAKDIVIGNPRL